MIRSQERPFRKSLHILGSHLSDKRVNKEARSRYAEQSHWRYICVIAPAEYYLQDMLINVVEHLGV